MEVRRRQLIQALEPRATGNPEMMLRLADLLRAEGEEIQAVDWCAQALALASSDLAMVSRCRAFLSRRVPAWHFSMLADERRTSTYDAAIRRAVRPGARVLDIGTGSGLLAMMAARAGAAEVFTCEAEPAIARAAEEIIAANGYADRVRVIARHSTTLDAQTDLGGRVDVLLSEIIAGNLIGEGVLPAHEHAIRELLAPGARIVPAKGVVKVALASLGGFNPSPLTTVGGFDLSIFNRLRAWEGVVRRDSGRLQLRSDSADLFQFDFTDGGYCRPARTTLRLQSHGGRVEGVVQWFTLKLDDEVGYDTRQPADTPPSWVLGFHPLAQPRDTAADEILTFEASHDRSNLLISLAS